MTVTFFGHSQTPQSVQPLLQKVIFDLVENNGAKNFYIGNHGNFDLMAKKSLQEIKLHYCDITYTVVLAYLPAKPDEYTDYSDTVYPEDIENVPPRFAICRRNEWMIERSDVVITYVKHQYGGAAKYKQLAERKGKKVIELAELM